LPLLGRALRQTFQTSRRVAKDLMRVARPNSTGEQNQA
jgi:hypothetical protein